MMVNILLFSASESAKQSLLSVGYEDNREFIVYDGESDTYDLVAIARYPHTYSRSGIQSVITMKVTQEQYNFISTLPSAIEILATCDNNPDNDYDWESPFNGNKAKFKTVVGNKFFTGSGVIGDEDYVAPRKKLAVLG